MTANEFIIRLGLDQGNLPQASARQTTQAMRQRRRVGHWLAHAAVECLRLGGTAAELAALAGVAETLRRRPPG